MPRKFEDSIDRLEKAEGPSRELDYQVLLELYGKGPSELSLKRGGPTQSFDEAADILDRMLPGYSWTMDSGWQGCGPQASIASPAPHMFWQSYRAGLEKNFANCAIALLLALFRALQAQEESEAA